MPELEYPSCLLCGSARATRSFERQFSPHALARCADCGFCYLSPRVAEREMAGRYAAESYYQSGDGTGYQAYATQDRALRATYRALVRRLVARGLAGGTLLEIGAGYGYFLAEAKGAFSELHATEMSKDAARRADEHADRLMVGGIEAVPSDNRYHLIVALQVIEHIYDPRDFVRRCVRLLHPGGHLLLAAPNMDSPLRWLLGANWPSFKVPEHVSYFDVRSLSRLMRDQQLQALERLSYPHAFPASLIADKLRLALPSSLREWPIWIPTTTAALVGRARG